MGQKKGKSITKKKIVIPPISHRSHSGGGDILLSSNTHPTADRNLRIQL